MTVTCLEKISSNPDRINLFKISLLYLLLIAGGLWHLLGVLQNLMFNLAAPFLIVLALALFFEIFATIRCQTKQKSDFIIWSSIVFAGGFLIEIIGVRTGHLFGQYEYGHVLKPVIAGVPIAIGFAWLAIQLSALGVADRIGKKLNLKSIFIPFLTALLMVIFDVFMESAAVYLNYWRWLDGFIPIQNYFAWFVISLVFSYLGYALKIFQIKVPRFVFHSYIAQLIYFFMVDIKAF